MQNLLYHFRLSRHAAEALAARVRQFDDLIAGTRAKSLRGIEVKARLAELGESPLTERLPADLGRLFPEAGA